MQFLIGMMVASALFICSIVAYEAGKRSRRPREPQTDEEERKRAERLRQGFQDMMSYDVTTALKGKK